MIGPTLGHYKILDHIGSGGMGDVYRARDTNLKRDVAIKVLPAEFTRDPERLSRFQREAQVLASLNHPNIAAIYGLGQSDDLRFLVMELVEGEDLAQCLHRGALTVEDVIEIGRQLADGLEYAHELGVVHRDLKPANLKMTPEGRVKILDFGLAKAFAEETAEVESGLLDSPTVTNSTGMNVILGTAAYMSPEQARGKPVDRRSDIWAFGVVLHELLTGRQLFQGETTSDTIASVLRTEIDWGSLPPETPPGLLRLLRRCLDRNPRERLRDVGEARIALEPERLHEKTARDRTLPGAGGRGRERLVWVVVLSAAVTVTYLLAIRTRSRSRPPVSVTRFVETLETGMEIMDELGPPVILSPDGRHVAYLAGKGEDRRLFVRGMDELEPRELAGTEGALQPFFSPDGEWIAFFGSSHLKRVAVGGGAPLTICEAVGNQVRGGAWGKDGSIVFAPAWEGGLVRVQFQGGVVETLTVTRSDRNERSHRWPDFLSDGRGVVFLVQHHARDYQDGDIEVVMLDTGERHVLHHGGAFPRILPGNRLAFVRDRTVFTVPLDASGFRLTGSPRPVLEGVLSRVGDQAAGDGSAQFDVSETGTLVYRPELTEKPPMEMVWVDRGGRSERIDSPPRYTMMPRLSPDGRRILCNIEYGGKTDFWLFEFESRVLTRITNRPGSVERGIWHPDNRHVVYLGEVFRDGQLFSSLLWKDVDGLGEERVVFESPNQQNPLDWTPDGRELILHQFNEGTGWDIMAAPWAGEENLPIPTESLRPVVQGAAQEMWGDLSPDGRWLAYSSNESGPQEIMVCAYRNPRMRWRISTGGGRMPLWASDGLELYYRAGDAIMAAPVRTGEDRFQAGTPVELFRGNYIDLTAAIMWDAARDGRFLMLRRVRGEQEDTERRVVFCLGWLGQEEAGD